MAEPCRKELHPDFDHDCEAWEKLMNAEYKWNTPEHPPWCKCQRVCGGELIEPGECLTTGGHVYERVDDGGPSGWLRQCVRCGNKTDRPTAPPRPDHDRPYA